VTVQSAAIIFSLQAAVHPPVAAAMPHTLLYTWQLASTSSDASSAIVSTSVTAVGNSGSGICSGYTA